MTTAIRAAIRRSHRRAVGLAVLRPAAARGVTGPMSAAVALLAAATIAPFVAPVAPLHAGMVGLLAAATLAAAALWRTRVAAEAATILAAVDRQAGRLRQVAGQRPT